MKKKLVLISVLALGAVTTFTARGAELTQALQQKYRGHLDMNKFHKGHAIEVQLQRQKQAFPGGGFIDPEQNLSRTDKEDLAYYRRWKQAV